MALKVSDIIAKAVRVLLRDTDEGGIQWTDPELIRWFNEACSEVARLLPESSSVTGFHPFVAGTRQSVPAGATMLLEVLYNAVDADTPGRVIRRVERHTLDNERPSWHMDEAKATALRYMVSLTDPRTFHIYPASDATGGCIMTYAIAPNAVASGDEALPLPDIYQALLVNYICYRAWLKMLEQQGAQEKSDAYYALFVQGIQASGGSLEMKNAKVRDPIVPQRL